MRVSDYTQHGLSKLPIAMCLSGSRGFIVNYERFVSFSHNGVETNMIMVLNHMFDELLSGSGLLRIT